MPTPWFPTGIADYEAVELSREDKERLGLEISAKGQELKDADEFHSLIEHALMSYKAMSSLRDESRPSEVRKNFKKSLDSALLLNDRLNEMDANSRLILSRKISGGITTLHRHLGKIISALSEGSHAADEFPKGRLTDYARLELARVVIKALKSQGIEPTTTKEGLFSNVLAIVLEMATGKPVSAVHALAAEAIRTYRSDS
ncbi:anti-sigma factor [Thiohalobacter thiocyanaticus]|uniref:Anti-sigma factor n=1 Tax=Thiohalobacter thiocyanaticus TaxID=585455 RepID=A0A1Z4VLZ0_9GAMM|nr:hypothetical protein [Thiohalobacter thiocyanaticus]BAZ92607.1 anti-sigma factor [Thiohalobacter thiocyanaticus]